MVKVKLILFACKLIRKLQHSVKLRLVAPCMQRHLRYRYVRYRHVRYRHVRYRHVRYRYTLNIASPKLHKNIEHRSIDLFISGKYW